MVGMRCAESVSEGHPDKFCDQVADRIVDEVLSLSRKNQIEKTVRTAIECLAKENFVIVSGEIKVPLEIRSEIDVVKLVREVWQQVGYQDVEDLEVVDRIGSQSSDISRATDLFGAGDQGIMIGYATRETPEMMPLEWLYARNLVMRLRELRLDGSIPWLRSDCKSQVTLDRNGSVTSVIIAVQHTKGINREEIEQVMYSLVIEPVLGDVNLNCIKINGTGQFVVGGPSADAGVVGRKIVVDAYGPAVPVGGGAYSGKDPTKVDRSAAYMARHIAKQVIANEIEHAFECTVKIAYGIGQHQPEMVTAMTDSGRDVSGWVRDRFPELSPEYIINYLGLQRPVGWSYFDTAAFGHYGRELFPWENIQ